nr:hypothetical protein K-LCC10_0121 [Kaumoebavirus]
MFATIYYKILRFVNDIYDLGYSPFILIYNEHRISDVEVISRDRLARRARLYFAKNKNSMTIYNWKDFKEKVSIDGEGILQLFVNHNTGYENERYGLHINFADNTMIRRDVGRNPKETIMPIDTYLRLI